MIYKILTIFAIIGLGAAAVLPSDLIEHRAFGGPVILSGADPKIFKDPAMQLAPLGPSPLVATDLQRSGQPRFGIALMNTSINEFAAAEVAPIVDVVAENATLVPLNLSEAKDIAAGSAAPNYHI